jgi:hypothetical protein
MAALLAACAVGFAADPKGLKIEITPYMWLAGLEGDVTIDGREADFEKSASDLLDAVDAGGSLLGVVPYDRFLFWGQVDFFSLSTDELEVEDQPEGGSLDTDMLLGEAAVGYQIDGWSEGQTFDLLVGVRTLTIDNELTVDGRGTVSTDDRREEKESRVDAMLVVRPSLPVFPSKIDGLRFNPTLAIGGGDSDLVYEMFPQFQYQITENLAARLGYRTVGYKLKGDENEDNELNIRLAGLIAGLGVTF